MRLLLLLLCILLVISASVSARTWYVSKDGTGDATIIWQAMEMASYGDTVLVGPGTYTESLCYGSIVPYGSCGWRALVFMKAGVTLMSEQGPEVTTLDAAEASTTPEFGAAVMCLGTDGDYVAVDIEITGFTIIGARRWGIYISGPYGFDGPVAVKDNVILDSGQDANAVCVGGVAGVIDGNLIDCPQGIDGIETGAPAHLDMTVSHNWIRALRRGVHISGYARIEQNLVFGATWGILIGSGGPHMTSNTIVSCGTALYPLGPVGSGGSFSNNIVTGCGIAIDLDRLQNRPGYDCNCLWDNGTDYRGCEPAPNDFYEDPLFCDPDAGDYTLQECSPCVDGYGCGQVGAHGVGCGPSKAVSATWGSIKSLYR